MFRLSWAKRLACGETLVVVDALSLLVIQVRHTRQGVVVEESQEIVFDLPDWDEPSWHQAIQEGLLRLRLTGPVQLVLPGFCFLTKVCARPPLQQPTLAQEMTFLIDQMMASEIETLVWDGVVQQEANTLLLGIARLNKIEAVLQGFFAAEIPVRGVVNAHALDSRLCFQEGGEAGRLGLWRLWVHCCDLSIQFTLRCAAGVCATRVIQMVKPLTRDTDAVWAACIAQEWNKMATRYLAEDGEGKVISYELVVLGQGVGDYALDRQLAALVDVPVHFWEPALSKTETVFVIANTAAVCSAKSCYAAWLWGRYACLPASERMNFLPLADRRRWLMARRYRWLMATLVVLSLLAGGVGAVFDRLRWQQDQEIVALQAQLAPKQQLLQERDELKARIARLQEEQQQWDGRWQWVQFLQDLEQRVLHYPGIRVVRLQGIFAEEVQPAAPAVPGLFAEHAGMRRHPITQAAARVLLAVEAIPMSVSASRASGDVARAPLAVLQAWVQSVRDSPYVSAIEGLSMRGEPGGRWHLACTLLTEGLE